MMDDQFAPTFKSRKNPVYLAKNPSFLLKNGSILTMKV